MLTPFRRELRVFRRVKPLDQSPATEDRQNAARQIGDKPDAVENANLACLFDDAARQDRSRSSEHHLVENGGGVSNGNQQPFSNIGSISESERLYGPDSY